MSSWYALIDCARDANLYPLVQRCADRQCLFAGAIDPKLAPACPYIVRIDEHEPLITAWREHGAGRHWGILCRSDLPLAALRRQLRKFLTARLPDGMVVLFRFYDPRVFPTYIRSAPADQAAAWFDGVSQYAVEGAREEMHYFRWYLGRLHDGDTPIPSPS